MKEIPLEGTQLRALVDDEDYDHIVSYGKWQLHNKGYAWQSCGGKGFLMMHWLVLPGDGNKDINHKDGNKLNNTRSNLECITHQQNISKYYNSVPTKSYLGRKGVYVCGSGRYVATIMWKGKRYHIGTFDTLEEAGNAYDNRRKELLEGTFSYA